MDWNTVFWIGGLVLFFWIMVRGCGGMMRGRGGACGMPQHRADKDPSGDRKDSERKKTA